MSVLERFRVEKPGMEVPLNLNALKIKLVIVTVGLSFGLVFRKS